MMMQIDPTKWPKVEARAIPSKGRYWCVSKASGDVHLSSMFNGNESYNDNYTHYGPIEFIPPKVIPPKPEFVCVENIRPHDAYLGKTGWGVVEDNGDAWPVINGRVYCFSSGSYKIIDKQ